MASCTCLTTSRDPLCAWHGDLAPTGTRITRLMLQLAAAEGRIMQLEEELRAAVRHTNNLHTQVLTLGGSNDKLLQENEGLRLENDELQDALSERGDNE